jgi:hypothetical protein
MRHNTDPISIPEAMQLLGLTKQGLRPKLKGGQKKLTAIEVKACRSRYWHKKATIRHLAEQYDVSYTTMRCAVRRKDAYDDVRDMY